ncbi:MAG: ATP-binding protein [Nitrospirae bacterium]|nr:ATP-binding protein [Nitrospirota bacterium]
MVSRWFPSLLRSKTAWSPEQRLIWSLSTVITLLMLVYGAVLIGKEQIRTREQAERRGLALARGLVSVGGTVVSDNLYLVQRSLTEGVRDPDIRRVLVLDAQRMVIASDQVALIGTTLANDMLCEAEKNGREYVSIGADEQGQERMVVFEPVHDTEERDRAPSSVNGSQLNDPQPHPAGWILVELSLEESRTQAYNMLTRQLLATLVLLLVTVTVVRKTVRRLSGALRTAEDQFRSIVESEPECVTTVSLDGTLLSINPTGLALVEAHSADEIIGQPVVSLIHPDDRAAFQQAHHAICKGQSGILSFRMRGLRGALRWVEAHSAPLRDTQQNIISVLSINRDITDQRRMEQALHDSESQLRQSQKMEAMGKLAGGIAHDFNNLLTVVIGCCSLLRNRLDMNDLVRKNVERIQAAGERGALLTQQLLAFSRQQVLQPQVLNLNEAIANIVPMLQPLLGEHIKVLSVFTRDLGLVEVDPGQMDQVIMNLAVNARDAMPDGGTLTLETANVELKEQTVHFRSIIPAGSYVTLTITDTGCGMDAETQARIFDPFFTTKEVGKGTGLGLSMTYGIVKQSGGVITVHSEPKHGAIFTLYLPRVKPVALPEENGARQGQAAMGSETILLVEDNEMVRQISREALQENGYQVLEASGGPAAMKLCQAYEKRIHLLLTDVVMPGMSGWELAHSIQPMRVDIKVLYISGYTDLVENHQSVLEPGVAFLQKPFTPNELTHKIREVLDAPLSS